jgi:SNF2 family DNA or RNA helicase
LIQKAALGHTDKPRKDSVCITFSCDETGIPGEFEIWLRERGAVKSQQNPNSFYLTADNFLSSLDDFRYLRSRFGGFPLEHDSFFANLMENYRREKDALSAAQKDVGLRVKEKDVEEGLKSVMFLRWNKQSPDQLRDIGRLSLLPNGANFSVPGAGKTNALLAVNALERIKRPDLKLLIVCPKNAMVSWDEEVSECLGPEWRVARLEGGKRNIIKTLVSSPRIAVISYQQVRGVVQALIDFMDSEEVHLVLDESHRIKAGENSLQGAATLALAAHAVRRDILSGTPMPQGLSDLESQFRFLWPSLPVFKEIPPNASPEEQVRLANQLIRPLFVRTTKDELGLPKPRIHYRGIEMSDDQAETYALLKSESARFFAGLIPEDKDQFRKIGKQVMRVLQFCSNPELLRRSLNGTDQYGELYFQLNNLRRELPSKTRHLDELVRNILERPLEKVVIWSMFVDQIEILVELFKHFGATSIHGAVPTGPDDSTEFREGRIRLFKEDPNCRVLIANPSACGEGISLHKTAHNAVYFDRSFNAAHFLQSIDRIHRRGLPVGAETNVYILFLKDTLEEAVRDRLSTKIRALQKLLDDEDLAAMVYDPEDLHTFGEEGPLEISDIEAVMKAMK